MEMDEEREDKKEYYSFFSSLSLSISIYISLSQCLKGGNLEFTNLCFVEQNETGSDVVYPISLIQDIEQDPLPDRGK